MTQSDHLVQDNIGKCGRCSDVVVARGGWGLTTRYCVIRSVRMVVICQVAMLTPQVTRLLGWQ